jgi:putative ABC transport system permease protein
MSIWLIIAREYRHKWFAFLTGVLSLVIATAGVVGALTLLRGHDQATERILIETERELRAEMVALEDDYRIIMRKMGYNVLIVNREQSFTRLQAEGYADTYLDYEDVWKIAESGLESLNHLLPVLQGRVRWDEGDSEIMISGVRGQVPVYGKPGHLTEDHEYRSPMMERVPEGKADLGAEIAVLANLRPGDRMTIQGEKFEVNRVFPRRGTRDDLIVWIPLDKAQAILDRPGTINGILALECVCHSDRLGTLHRQVEAILPHAKVFEFSSLIAARADVRERAAELHRQVMASTIAHRIGLRREKERFASILIPILVLGATVWIFFIIFNNVRERRREIGILRAVGFRRSQVLRVFLGKSLLMGIVAGALGCFVGVLLGVVWSSVEPSFAGFAGLLSGPLLLTGLLLAPVLALAAGLIPAVIAANQDPAVMLSEE